MSDWNDWFSKEHDVDFTVVVSPALLIPNEDVVMTTYKGPDDVTASVSFGRQLSTGGSEEGLPSGSVVEAVPPSGCADKVLLRMSGVGGLDRTGVFFTEASRDDVTTRIQWVVIPPNGTK